MSQFSSQGRTSSSNNIMASPSSSSSSLAAANFHSQAATNNTGANFQSIDANANNNNNTNNVNNAHANFDNRGSGNHNVSNTNTHQEAAMAIMEQHIDMDELLCYSELFSREAEEAAAVAAVASVTGVSAVELAALATAGGVNNGGVEGGFWGVASGVGVGGIHMGGGFSEAVAMAPYVRAVGAVAGSSGLVTDCASSADGSQGSELTVPSTIAVPTGMPPATTAKLFCPPANKALHPALKPAVSGGVCVQVQGQGGAMAATLATPLQFSNPSNGNVGVNSYAQHQAKRQRSNSGMPVVHPLSNAHVNAGVNSQGFGNGNNGQLNHHGSNGIPPSANLLNSGRNTNFLNSISVSNSRPTEAEVQADASAQHRMPLRRDEVLCVKCNFPGADVKINCGSGAGCSYHARCLDLAALCRDADPAASSHEMSGNSSSGEKATKGSRSSSTCHKNSKAQEICVRNCPHCSAPAEGIEILPLSFAEMDRVQHSARAAFMNSGLPIGNSMSMKVGGLSSGNTMGGSSNSSGANIKRSHDLMSALGALPTAIPSHSGTQPPRRNVQCYDPSQPRTGRWTDEEILFRDTLISHFLSGSLPLSNGLKLNDFLPVMLKSKQSRLAKKMKHAKLSTKYFYPKGGCISSMREAKELSKLERDFVSTIPDPVERSEVSFHMSREWREHLANRLASLSIPFDGRAWLSSVEDMERRLAFEKERHRLVKRRFMMGKAMEKDCGEGLEKLERGVFVNTGGNGKEEFELVVEKSVSNSAGTNGRDRSIGGDSFPIFNLGKQDKEASTNVWSSNEPNFKQAAPFLAGIASYIERNGVPFEHVDVWVPSFVEGNATEGSGLGSLSPGGAASILSQGSSGMPTAGPANNFRLCFGGSVTMGVQIVKGSSDDNTSSSSNTNANPTSAGTKRRVPLSADEKSNYSLFGDYSEKFSFNSGCGLPGRIFKTGVPAWEQFVSEAHPSLFERRGGAVEFGVKTAVGLPVDSPNVGRVVLVLYSKYDRTKDERLVGRMMTDLKLLNPCPRWKLVVEVDSLNSDVGDDGKSSLAPPPAGSPVLSASTQASGLLMNNTSGSGGTPQAQAPVTVNPKEKQIRDLILLLGENIPSDPNSPLGAHLQPIMSLRLILLRGNLRTTEEEALIDTVLVLFDSYIHAGRSRSDIAVMVSRDFTFHLGHQQSFACSLPQGQQHQQQQPQQYQGPTPPGPHGQGPPPNMYAAQAHGSVPSPIANMGASPLMGPMMNGYGAANLQPQLQVRSPTIMANSPPLMGANPMMNYNALQHRQQQYGRSLSMPFPRQESQSSFVDSSRSTASR